MKHTMRLSAAALALAGLAGCATPPPSGPSHMVLPGSSKNFDQFRADDYDCRNYANSQIGGATPANAAADAGVRSAVVGTLIGAAAGAAIGGNHEGAAVGAGTGLLVGSAAGSDAANYSGRELQRRYDIAYDQCMYAKGHRVPVYGQMIGPTTPTQTPAQQAAPFYPPPAPYQAPPAPATR